MLYSATGQAIHSSRYYVLLGALSAWVEDEGVVDVMVREFGQDDTGMILAAVGCTQMEDPAAPKLREEDLVMIARNMLARRGRVTPQSPAPSTGLVRREIMRLGLRCGMSPRGAVRAVWGVEREAK